MRAITTTLSVFSLFLVTVAASPTDLEFKEAFENLREGNPVEIVHKSYFVILSAEEKAFPMLLQQKKRTEIAKKAVFQESRVDKDPKTGEIIGLHAPQMGEVALMLIESQVMGRVPYSCWPYRIFDRSNVEEWLGKHKGRSLIELESAAAKESLELAEAAHIKEPDEGNKGAIAFFKGRLDEIEEKKKANKS